jgi:hypothetical protein
MKILKNVMVLTVWHFVLFISVVHSEVDSELANAISDIEEHFGFEIEPVNRDSSEFYDLSKIKASILYFHQRMRNGSVGDVYVPSHVIFYFTTSNRYRIAPNSASGLIRVDVKNERSFFNFFKSLNFPFKNTKAHKDFLKREQAIKELILEYLKKLKDQSSLVVKEKQFSCRDSQSRFSENLVEYDEINETNYDQTTSFHFRPKFFQGLLKLERILKNNRGDFSHCVVIGSEKSKFYSHVERRNLIETFDYQDSWFSNESQLASELIEQKLLEDNQTLK